ncbi:MAG TPA: protein phosphatase 2C domain-containing protein [Pyrinomonadaceae bacterium]|nr:protein phosphatase 2C domain-containing protein [Pyrinomonadaceae bacterium]
MNSNAKLKTGQLNDAKAATQPLNIDLLGQQFPDALSSNVRVDVFGLTHRGLVRPNNEDHFLVVRGGRELEAIMGNLPPDVVSRRFDEVFYGMAVADGLGGEVCGEIASRRALESLLSMVLHTPDWMLRLGKPEINEVMWRMADRFIRVHAALLHEAAQDPYLQGMSTTLTTALTMGDDLIITHVGDSRVYLIRDGQMRQLTRDHTLAQQLIDAGIHNQNDQLVKELRNVLKQALGAKVSECRPEVDYLKLADGDQLLLCTDGLTDTVESGVIAQVLNKNNSAKATAEELLGLALEKGGPDNITLIVSRYAFPKRE